MGDGLFLDVGHGIDVHILGDRVNDARMHIALIAQFREFGDGTERILGLSSSGGSSIGLSQKCRGLERSDLTEGRKRRWEWLLKIWIDSRNDSSSLRNPGSACAKRSRQGRPATNGVVHYVREKADKSLEETGQKPHS